MDSAELFKRASKWIPGGVNSPVRAFRAVGGSPFFTESAKACRLKTVEGRELLDYVGSWGPMIHGHAKAEIHCAIEAALSKGVSFGTPNPYEPALAELIVRQVPSAEKVRFMNSGTEAAMTAVRLARGVTRRDKILKFAGCYHGHADALLVEAGSGALTLGVPNSAGVPESFSRETLVLNFNDFDALDAAFRRWGEQIACLILEPYPANCGLIFPKAGYLQSLRKLCDTHGSLLIFDEVMTGFRVGPGGVQARENILPDLTVLGKIIGGGLPVGAVCGSAQLMDELAPTGSVYQAGTLSGNPLAMAAGIASIELLVRDDPYAELELKTRRIKEALLAAAAQRGIALQVPQTDSMFCLCFTDKSIQSAAEVQAADAEMFKKCFQAALKLGVFLPPSSFETCFLGTAHDAPAIERTCEVLSSAIASL